MSHTPFTLGDQRRFLKERRTNSRADYMDWLFFNVLYWGLLLPFVLTPIVAGLLIGAMIFK